MLGRHEPRIVRGEIRHTRLKPFLHSFRYRGFYIQLPLRSLGERAGSGLAWGLNQPALLSVHDRDHGDGTPLLKQALETLLQAGVTDADGEIWLQTFPRMFGYVFKPVSFWFCQRTDGSLCAIIAEVNNTFGDRHTYVLKADGREIRNGQSLKTSKAFYVSPFFPVRGRYTFRFFKSAINGPDVARIEYADDSGVLLLTSMSGRSSALTGQSAVMTWLSYPLFSLGVIARIHLQALVLWWKGAKLVTRPRPNH